MDEGKVEKVLRQVVQALRTESFGDFQTVLFTAQDYLNLARQINGNLRVDESEAKLVFQALDQKIATTFRGLLQKGTDRGLTWKRGDYAGDVSRSEELVFGKEIKEVGFVVDCHLRMRWEDQKFTLIGLQLWLWGEEYRIKGDEIRGLFAIDLDVFVPSDDFDGEEMEENGY